MTQHVHPREFSVSVAMELCPQIKKEKQGISFLFIFAVRQTQVNFNALYIEIISWCICFPIIGCK